MPSILDRLGLSVPIIQAPMAGVSTPRMAAAVSNAGALGSIAVGAGSAEEARKLIEATCALTQRPFNVNVFAHRPPRRNEEVDQAWLKALAPHFEAFDAEPPAQLKTIYNSFVDDDRMLSCLVETAPAVVSLHFGLIEIDRIRALQSAGSLCVASVTSLEEARACQAVGVDAVIAQGYEAGGHRGVFDPDAPDEKLSVWELTRRLVDSVDLPIIAAGGLMTGKDIKAALDHGASAAQLGTAFIACPE
ncbi:hypothetical protein LTR94_024958, partial [Friedmanniomyces endolithicus]